jgi:hypothetical protein
VDHFAAATVVDRFSLTDADLSAIRAALPTLQGHWSLLTESGDEGELYVRLLPPWGDNRHSAFLIEREEKVVILTDNLSETERCRVSGFPSAALAMETVRRVVLGDGRR